MRTSPSGQSSEVRSGGLPSPPTEEWSSEHLIPWGDVPARMDGHLLVSPSKGRIRFANTADGQYADSTPSPCLPQSAGAAQRGEFVTEGETIGWVIGPGGAEFPIISPVSGWIGDVLVRSGWPVLACEALVYVRPTW